MSDDEAMRKAHQPDRPTGYQCCDTAAETQRADEAEAHATMLYEALLTCDGAKGSLLDIALQAHRARKP